MPTKSLPGHLACGAELVEGGLGELEVDRKLVDRHDAVRLLPWHVSGSAAETMDERLLYPAGRM